jgi:hypothetical protein
MEENKSITIIQIQWTHSFFCFESRMSSDGQIKAGCQSSNPSRGNLGFKICESQYSNTDLSTGTEDNIRLKLFI